MQEVAIDRSAVVFLHGLASNHTRWSELAAQTSLQHSHALLLPDLRGHGATAQVHACGDLRQWQADLSVLLTRHEHERVHLVGHSLGAQVAMHFAARNPQRVSSLFLIDPVLRDALHRRNRWFVAAAPLFRLLAALVHMANRLGIYRRQLVPLDLRELDAAARIALQTPENTEAFIKQYSSSRADLKHIHTRQYVQDLVALLQAPPDWSRITCPVRVLLSTGATFADAAATRRALSQLPQVSFASIDCHHWPVTEKPDEVRTAIERWVTLDALSHEAGGSGK